MGENRLLDLAKMLPFLFAFIALDFIKRIFYPVYRIIFAPKVPLVVRTPDERFHGLDKIGYTFEPNYINLGSLPRIHYVDEGPRDAEKTILCLHGEPSWSFLYRHMVPILVNAGYRVVAPDFIGFGKSDKYTSVTNYNHELHMNTVKLLIKELELENITLVCQDWGGLTGLTVVKDIPESFSSLVIMNTGIPTGEVSEFLKLGDGSYFSMIHKLVPFLLWRNFVSLVGFALPIGRVFSAPINSMPEEATKGYEAPFPDATYKAGTVAWPLLVPLYRDDAATPHMREAKSCLSKWNKPALVMFGDKDPVSEPFYKWFLDLIPNPKSHIVKGAEHFLQETHGKELSEKIIQFLEGRM